MRKQVMALAIVSAGLLVIFCLQAADVVFANGGAEGQMIAAVQQGGVQSSAKMGKSGMMRCPMCGKPMYEDGKNKPGMMMGGMMQGQGMGGCPVCAKMKKAVESAGESPQGMLMFREVLELSEEQVSELESIIQRAKEDAQEVLTDEQQQKIEFMQEMPKHMMQMHKKMQEEGGMGCPWMQDDMQDQQGKPADQMMPPRRGMRPGQR